MKKIFGGINLTWKKVVVSAIIIGVSVGLLNSVPSLFDTTVTDIATYFDFWILCGILIIMNSKSNMDSALKCFVFFLISQPLIYLVEVPFKSMGWELFIYYKPWFIWTLLTIPMGFIGYFMKKNKWYSLLILIPMLVLLSTSITVSITGMMYAFPHHLINTILVIGTLLLYPLVLFEKNYLKITGLIISLGLLIFWLIMTFTQNYSYETEVKCSNDTFYFDDKYKAYLKDEKFGETSIIYMESIDEYCVHNKFKKSGDTTLIIESPSGDKKEYNLHIGKNTYSIDDDE